MKMDLPPPPFTLDDSEEGMEHGRRSRSGNHTREPDLATAVVRRNRRSLTGGMTDDHGLSQSEQDHHHHHNNISDSMDWSEPNHSSMRRSNPTATSSSRTMTMSLRHKHNKRSSTTSSAQATARAPSTMRLGTPPGRHPSNASSAYSSGMSSNDSSAFAVDEDGSTERFPPPSRSHNYSGASSTHSALSGFSGTSTRSSGVSSTPSRRSSAAGSEKRGLGRASGASSRGSMRSSIMAPPGITEESLAQLEASHPNSLTAPADGIGVGAFHVSESAYVDPLGQTTPDSEEAIMPDQSYHSSHLDPSFRDEMQDGSSASHIHRDHSSHPSMSGSDRLRDMQSEDARTPELPQATISSSQRHVMADNSSRRHHMADNSSSSSRRHRGSRRSRQSARNNHQYQYPAPDFDEENDPGYTTPVEMAPDSESRSPVPEETVGVVRGFFAKRQEHEQVSQRVLARKNRCRIAVVCLVVLGILVAVVLIVALTVRWGNETSTTDSVQAAALAGEHLPGLPDVTTLAFQRSNSPQTQAMLWLGQDPNLPSLEQDRKEQRFAMATILYSMAMSSAAHVQDKDLDLNAFVNTWLPYGLDECSLKKYKCNNDGQLTSISLVEAMPWSQFPGSQAVEEEGVEENAPLMGLPAELSLLTALESLSLDENDWTGVRVEHFLPPPPTIAALTNLGTLTCQNCGLVGALPQSWPSYLPKMSHLELGGNSIQGPLPSSWGQWSSLVNVALDGNLLDETLPSEIGLMESLNILDLDGNQLTGFLPSELLLLSNLDTLALSDNKLILDKGEDAQALLDQLTTLIPTLETDDNIATSKIPADVELFRQLRDAKVIFVGTLPTEIGLWSTLRDLKLSRSSLNGSIPSEIGGMALLENLDLAGCGLTGWIPSEIGLLQNLTQLDVYDNLLSATIPSELGLATSLTDINVANNMLTGTLPDELTGLTNLESLYIGGQFGDGLEQSPPKDLCDATFLVPSSFRSDRCSFSIGDCCH